MPNSSIKPLEPNEKIELELFKRALQDVAESQETGTDLAQLMQTATDLVAFGSMNKDDALRGLITCLIVRVKSYRDECLAHRKDAEAWHKKWEQGAMYAANARNVVADSLAGATIDDRLTSSEVCFDLKRVAGDPACPPSARRTAQDAIDVLFRNGALMLTEMEESKKLRAALHAKDAQGAANGK